MFEWLKKVFGIGRKSSVEPGMKFRLNPTMAWIIQSVRILGRDVCRELEKGRKPTRQIREMMYFFSALLLIVKDPRKRTEDSWFQNLEDLVKGVQEKLPSGYELDFPGLWLDNPEFYAYLRYPLQPDGGSRRGIRIDFDFELEFREREGERIGEYELTMMMANSRI